LQTVIQNRKSKKSRGDYMSFKSIYIISIGNFRLVYSLDTKIKKFEYLSYKQYKVINTIYQLVKFNVILKLYVSNRLKESVYSINDNVNIIMKAKSLLEMRIFSDTVYINDIDASILQTYIERFLQKIDFIEQESIPN